MSALDQIALAQGLVQSGALELVRNREVTTLNHLVSAHFAKTLTDRDAAIGIAVIASPISAASRSLSITE